MRFADLAAKHWVHAATMLMRCLFGLFRVASTQLPLYLCALPLWLPMDPWQVRKQTIMSDMKPDERFKASLARVFAGKTASEKQFWENLTITKEEINNNSATQSCLTQQHNFTLHQCLLDPPYSLHGQARKAYLQGALSMWLRWCGN